MNILKLVDKIKGVLPRNIGFDIVVLIAIMVLTSLMETATVGTIYVFMSFFTDQDVPEFLEFLIFFGDNQVFYLLIFSVVILLLSSFTRIVGAIKIHKESQILGHKISMNVLYKLSRKNISFFSSKNSSTIAKDILHEVHQVTNSGIYRILVAFNKLVTVVAIVTFMFFSAPYETLAIILFGTALYLVVFKFTGTLQSALGADYLRYNEKRYFIISEILRSIKEIKLRSKEKEALGVYEEISKRYSSSIAKSLSFSEIPKYLIETLVFISIILIIGFVEINSESSLEEFRPKISLFLFGFYKLLPSAQSIYESLVRLKFVEASVDALLIYNDELSQLGDVYENEVRFNKMIEFKEVRFSYEENVVFNSVSIVINKGDKVGLMGVSGGGKSTLIELLCGILSPNEGQISIDGVDLSQQTVRGWQRLIGYVPQEVFLLDGTLLDNVVFRFHRAGAIDMEKAMECLDIAQLSDFVNELPDGLFSRVGENGAALSGGQKQRIGLARALYNNPEVLVLDEATSALDMKTERDLMENL